MRDAEKAIIDYQMDVFYALHRLSNHMIGKATSQAQMDVAYLVRDGLVKQTDNAVKDYRELRKEGR